jgi:predicted restriction endonuclease
MGYPGESRLLEWPVSLLDYEKRFATLRVNRGGANKSPHKVVMLQAVMDLVESGEVTNNRFYFDDDLKRHFTGRFQALASPSDRNNPHLPFFHLRSEGFWHHKIRPGRQEPYKQLTTSASQGVIEAHIDYAFLDDELFELLGNQIARELLRSALLTSLNEKSIRDLLQPERGGWDWLECEFLVNDYVTMLEKHLVGAVYS